MTVIDTEKLIVPSDIREGDRIRKHYAGGDRGKVREYVASHDGHTYGADAVVGHAWELLDRPRKVIHEKGKTLYAVKDWHRDWFMTGDAVTVALDHCEGDTYVRVGGQAGEIGGFRTDNFTDVKPETYVSVPQSAIDALIAGDEKAYAAPNAHHKNDIRRDAIITFLAAVAQ